MTNEQGDLFAAAQARRDAGVRSVARHADPEWKAVAGRIIEAMEPGTEFLAEDIRKQLDDAALYVHDRRALGGVLMSAARDGLITQAGFRRAKTSNLSPKVLWRRT